MSSHEREAGFLEAASRAGLSCRCASMISWRCAADSRRTPSCMASSAAPRSQRSSLPSTTICAWSSSLTIPCPKRASRPTSSQVTLDSFLSSPASPQMEFPCLPWSPKPPVSPTYYPISAAPEASEYLYWEALKTLVMPGLGRGRAFKCRNEEAGKPRPERGGSRTESSDA